MSQANPEQPFSVERINGWRERIRTQTLSHYQFHMGIAIEPTDPGAAKNWFRRAVEIDPDHAAAARRLAGLLSAEGETMAADAVLQAAALRNPQHAAMAEAMEIQALVTTGKIVAAADALASPNLVIAGAEPVIAEAALMIGQDMMQAGRTDTAIRFFDLALTADPRSLDATLGAVRAELQADRIQAALSRTNDAIRLHPDALSLKRLRVSACLNMGLPVDDDIQAILAEHPDDAQALRIGGQLKLIRNDAVGALADFTSLQDRAVAMDEKCMLHALCGHALYALGDQQAALAEFQQGVRLSNDQDSVLMALYAYALASIGQIGAADDAILKAADLVQRLPEKNMWALIALALACRARGRDGEARRYLDQCKQGSERMKFLASLFPWAKDEILSQPNRQ